MVGASAVVLEGAQELGGGDLWGDHVALHLGAVEEDGSAASVWGPLQGGDSPSPPRTAGCASSLGEGVAEAHSPSLPWRQLRVKSHTKEFS